MRSEQSRRWCGGVVSRSGRKRASPDSSTVERQPRKLEVLVRFLVGACWLFFPYPPNALFLSLDLILSFRRSKIIIIIIIITIIIIIIFIIIYCIQQPGRLINVKHEKEDQKTQN